MTTQTAVRGPINTVMLVSLAGLVATLALAFFNLTKAGHAAFNTSSDGVTWGLPVVTYVFFVLTSTGLTFVASLAMVFGFKDFYPIAKRCVWLALVTLIAGFAALAFELGHPFRMLWALPTSFQILSPLNWMGPFYALYLLLLILKFNKINGGDWDSTASRNLGVASFVSVVLAHGTLGMVFGAMAMRPMWYGPMIPLYFLLTAAVSGFAFATLVTHLSYGGLNGMPERVRTLMTGAMPKAFGVVLGIALLANIFRSGVGLWSNADGLQVWNHIIATPWYWIEMLSLLAALYVLLSPALRGDGRAQLIAALLVIVALFIGRFEFVISGQLLPMFKGAWVPGLVDYTPSLTEWGLTVMAFCIAFAGWALGERRVNLEAAPGEP